MEERSLASVLGSPKIVKVPDSTLVMIDRIEPGQTLKFDLISDALAQKAK
jgi:hypothetical protein